PNLDLAVDPMDPYAHYSDELLEEFLADFEASLFEKRGEMSYSNLGMGLLGYLIQQIAGERYEKRLQSCILDPLGMEETFVQRTTDSIPLKMNERFARAHRSGNELSHWRIDALAGAGAIVSSARDMMTFAAAHWSEETPTTLRKAMNLAAEVHSDSMGLGWFRQKNGTISHDGGTGGFRSSLQVDREREVATIRLENTSAHSHSSRDEVIGEVSSLSGFWSGTLETPVGDLRQVLRIREDGRAFLHSLDQGGAGIPASRAAFAEGKLEIEFPSIGGSFAATLHGDRLDGNWKQASDIPLALERSPTIPDSLQRIFRGVLKDPVAEVSGFWSGFLGGEEGLLVILEIEAIGETGEARLYSPDQTDQAIPVTALQFDGETIEMTSAVIEASFRGEWDGESEISGSWNQGGEIPLTLTHSPERPTRESIADGE
ncbi:MAG: serine hydrolase domain-containing protein, partial [Verrucomicrobiota bacterium]